MLLEIFFEVFQLISLFNAPKGYNKEINRIPIQLNMFNPTYSQDKMYFSRHEYLPYNPISQAILTNRHKCIYTNFSIEMKEVKKP